MSGYKIPGFPKFIAATPDSEISISLLGAAYSTSGVKFTQSEHARLLAFYGFKESEADECVRAAREEHEARVARAREEWEAAPAPVGTARWVPGRALPLPDPEKIKEPDYAGVRQLHVEGSLRNIYRHVQRDGLRLMAAISKFLDPGEDPVRLVLGLLRDAGYDVVDYWEDEDFEDGEAEE